MDVKIKTFAVKDLGIGSKGIEFEVRSPNGNHLGDLTITTTQLKWHRGRTRTRPKLIRLQDLISYMESL